MSDTGQPSNMPDAQPPTRNQKFVELLFEGILGRAPREHETRTFVSELERTADPAAAVERLVGSQEFLSRRSVRLFMPPGHFYSPIVDARTIEDLIPRQRPAIEVDIPGVDLDLAAMEAHWTAALRYLADAPFPDETSERYRYHFRNPAYSYGDALMLRAMILLNRPRRIIEIGSGYSSACTLDTVLEELDGAVDLTFIEPFPDLLYKLMKPGDRERVRMIPEGVQSVPIDTFEQLEANDILFIDSTHVLKTGSDVAYELAHVLPALRPGVLVHFHDMFYPFEYPYSWAVVENRSWNELYAIRAFLTFNSRFSIVFFADMFMQLRRDLIARTAPKFLQNSGGGLWLQVNDPAAAGGGGLGSFA